MGQRFRKAFVLLSGGLDSTTALHVAMSEFGGSGYVEAVSIEYGQRHNKEMGFAAQTCRRLNVRHTILDVGKLLGGSMLTDARQDIPKVTYDQIDGVSPTYVPFRNGLLLSAITAHAQKWIDAQSKTYTADKFEAGVFFGAHAEDAHNWAYPDCTPEFIGAMANAIYIGSYQAIRLHTPLMWMQKHEIVSLGHKLGVDFAQTWSCYAGGVHHCGECPTCYARQDAFKRAGVVDPTIYAVRPYTAPNRRTA